MHLHAFLAATALLLVASAGCLGLGNGAPDLAAVERDVLAAAGPLLVQDHDTGGHHDAAGHAGAYNLELVGYHNGVDDTGNASRIPAAGRYTEIAVRDNLVFLVRASANGSYGGFAILDVAVPSRPVLVGAYDGIGGADIELSDDGNLAFFAAQRNTIEQVATAGQASPQGAAPRGVHVVDVSDPREPTQIAFVPLPLAGPHTLTYHRHADGNEYLAGVTYDFLGSTIPSSTIPPLPVPLMVLPPTQKVVVLRIDRDGPEEAPVALLPVAQYQLLQPAPAGKLHFPHDTYVQVHPLTGRTLLYVSYWDLGLRIVDLSEPLGQASLNLPEVSRFTDFSPSALNAIHFARPFDELVAGRHVTVTEPEVIAARETGQITFLDTTDPANPTKLGHWRLPDGPAGPLPVRDLDFSPHNFDLWDGKVALGHYHAGVWVLAAGTEDDVRDPKAVAFYMPVAGRQGSPSLQPDVWGVLEHEVGGESLLFVSDQGSGLHILRYTGP